MDRGTMVRDLQVRDVGLGTAYERWAVYTRLERICAELGVKRALEGPVDGMAGIPGVHLLTVARGGVEVLVVQESEAAAAQVRGIYAAHGLQSRLDCQVAPLPPKGCGVDLVLSFNALPVVDDWRAYLAALFHTDATFAVVVVTNPRSYGVFLRKILRRFDGSGGLEELFDHEAVERSTLERELEKYGKILRHEYLDCPWWPDLFVPTGEGLWSGTLKRFGRRKKGAGDPRAAPFAYGVEDFPYGAATGAEELIRAMERHPGFEGAPRAVGRLFGHHQLFLVETTGRQRES